MAVHLKVAFNRAPVGGLEDQAVCTFDFNGPDVDTASATILRNHFATFFSSIASRIANNVTVAEYRFYNGYDGDGSPGDVDIVLTGGSTGASTSPMLPPQCACTITERTVFRTSWGRIYLPGFATSQLEDDGRWLASMVTEVADNAEVMYQAFHDTAAGHVPIVWSRPLGGPVAPVVIDAISVDNIVDIQRRRRWDATTLRAVRDLSV